MTVKQITWRLILPLTIVLFGTVTKWWYVLPVDAPDTMMYGFPLAFAAEGWHTSMSFQIFVFEFLFDFILYFLFLFILAFIVNRFWTILKISRVLTGALWAISVLIIFIMLFIASFPEHRIKVKRDWARQVMVTGIKFSWKPTDRTEFSK